jgi:hypothetical protein
MAKIEVTHYSLTENDRDFLAYQVALYNATVQTMDSQKMKAEIEYKGGDTCAVTGLERKMFVHFYCDEYAGTAGKDDELHIKDQDGTVWTKKELLAQMRYTGMENDETLQELLAYIEKIEGEK